MARDFPSFVMAMGIIMLPLGAWAAVNPMGILLLATSLSMINLQAQYTPSDFGLYLDSVVACELGIGIAFFCINAVRRFGAALP